MCESERRQYLLLNLFEYSTRHTYYSTLIFTPWFPCIKKS